MKIEPHKDGHVCFIGGCYKSATVDVIADSQRESESFCSGHALLIARGIVDVVMQTVHEVNPPHPET